MREIKFKGKIKNSDEWIIGDLIHYAKNDFRILEQKERLWDIQEAALGVIPDSIGQYIGKKDKNGVEIYSGDIVKDNMSNEFVIEYDRCYFRYALRLLREGDDIRRIYYFTVNFGRDIEIVDHIYNRPKVYKKIKELNNASTCD